MKQFGKKLLSLLLVVVLVLQIVPATVFATEETEDLATGNAPLTDATQDIFADNTFDAATAEEALASAEVLFEETSLREENVKHFRLNDGTYMAVQYDTPVHYRDHHGNWADFDNTLRPVNTLDGSGVSSYRVTNGDSVRVFAADANAEVLLAVQKGDYGLSLTPIREAEAELTVEPGQSALAASYELTAEDSETASAPATILETASAGEAAAGDDLLSEVQPDKIYSALEYPTSFQGATLRYENYANTVKESIVISAPQAEYTYSFQMETDGLTPALQADGSILFSTEDGNVIYSIPAPYMIDADNSISFDADYTLEEGNDIYTLTITADAAWMNDADRVFPVVLDPTITEGNLADESVTATYINSGYPGGTASDASGLYVGNNGSSNLMVHTLVHINDLIDLPDGSEVTYASFSLAQFAYQKQTGGLTSLDVGLYPMHSLNGYENYDISTSRWQNLMNVVTWNAVYGSSAYYIFDDSTLITDVATVSSATNGKSVTWDITILARQWYADSGSNLGFILRPVLPESQVTSRVSFYGPDTTTGIRPQLVVSYRNTVGIESQYSYQTAGIGRAGTAYISDATLHQTTVVPLLASASESMPFSLSLVYNSIYGNREFKQDSTMLHTKPFTNMNLGAGWKLSAQETVCSLEIEDTTYLIYTDADGTEHYFHYVGYSGGYKQYRDEDGLGLNISVNGTDFTMTDDYGNTKFFGNGYLKQQYDAYGNYLYFNYNGDAQLSTIKRRNKGCTTMETLVSFNYDNTKRLSSITDQANKTISFSYTTLGTTYSLSGIQFPDAKTMQYSYTSCSDGAYRMTTAYDTEANYGMEFGYAADGTISSFAEYVGTDRSYGAIFSAEKLSHNQTQYCYYGKGGTKGDTDDIYIHKVLDTIGRTINSYSTDYTQKHVLGVGVSTYTANSGVSKQNNRLTANVSAGQQGVNLLDNASIENASYSAIAAYAWSDSATGADVGDTAYIGELSLRLHGSTASTTPYYWQQSVTPDESGEYTFSGYIHVPSTTAFVGDGGACLSLVNSAGNTIAESEIVNYSTDSIGSGWIRLSVTADLTSESPVYARFSANNFTGAVYGDAFQLEQEESAATFNIIEDGSFEHRDLIDTSSSSHYWYKSDAASVTNAEETYFGEKTLLLPGSSVYQRISRSIPVNAPLESTFILSAWAKAAATPKSAATQGTTQDDLNPYFGLILRFYYSDGTSEAHYYPFDPYYRDWQYVQGVAVPQKTGSVTIESITIVAAYDANINNAYIDNISFRMEPVQTYTYDDNGNLITTAQTGAGETNAAYDGVDLISYTAANGSTIDYTYNSAHDILTATCDGVTGTYTYNTKGNVTKSTLTGGSLKLQSTAAYSTDGDHVTRVRNANNQIVEYAYNTADERLTSSTVMVTDSSGQEVIHSTSAYTYDNAGRITKTTLSNTSSELASISYSYPDGRLSSLARTSKRSGASQIQTYNFTYNAWGQSTAVKVGSTTLATYEYEKIGNSTNSADGGGNLTKMTYGNNQSVSYSYDSLDRLIKKTYNDTGSYVEYAYNSEGALARVSSYDSDNDLLAVYVFEYDGLGRLIRSAEYDGDNALVQRTEHIYDAYNRLSSQSWVIGNTSYSESYTYDDGASGDGSLTKMTTATGDTLNYTYDALKRLNKVTTKNASGTALFSTSYAFRNLSTTDGITQTTTQVQYRNVRIGTNGTILEGKKYSYDDVGNITKISQSTSPYNPLVAYEYDSQNQLTKETYYDGAGSATGNITKTIAYTYDTAGNILSETKTVGTTTTTKSYTYSTGNWKDLLKAVTVNGTNYSISSSGGNPTNWYNGSKTYTGLTWQQGRQLAGLTVGETSVSYEYDADGIRTKMVAGDVTYEFVTQDGKLMRETATNSSAVYVMDFIYDNAGRPFAVKFSKNGGSSFTTFYYVLNLQGDVVAITKADGTVVAKYTYDAWGNLTSLINANGTEIVNRTTGTAIAFWNPLTYRGYIRDRETGFYYLQSRYYDPANHRFINADGYTSTGQGFAGTNMFAYCGNNPVSRIDSTGQFWNEIWGFVQNVVLEVGNAIKEFIPQYVGCGALALLDGPVPVLDVFAIAGAAIITVGAIGYGVYRAIQTPAKSTLKAEEKEKDITLPPFPTVIYRYGGTNPGNLTPKEKDKFTGLSFSTVPMPGAAMTTIEALNATGLVYAVRDGATHVSVRPIGGTMDDWINAGSSSVWTQAVKSVVIKIK